MFADKVISPPQRCSTRQGSGLTHKLMTKLLRLAMDKHASSPSLNIFNEEKMFYNLDSRASSSASSACTTPAGPFKGPSSLAFRFNSFRRFHSGNRRLPSQETVTSACFPTSSLWIPFFEGSSSNRHRYRPNCILIWADLIQKIWANTLILIS